MWNQIILWNAIEILKTLPDNSIDLVITDPPYKTIKWGNKKTFWTGFWSSVLQKNDWKIFKYNEVNISEYIYELYRVLKEWTHCYIMTNNINLEKFLTESRKAWFLLHNLLIWDKWNKIKNHRYMKSFEPILFLRKWRAKHINNLWHDTILKHKNLIGKLRKDNHPTEKPVSLFEQMILNSSNQWDIVLDPFIWRGSSMKACLNTNRKWVWIEIDEEHYNVAIQYAN